MAGGIRLATQVIPRVPWEAATSEARRTQTSSLVTAEFPTALGTLSARSGADPVLSAEALGQRWDSVGATVGEAALVGAADGVGAGAVGDGVAGVGAVGAGDGRTGASTGDRDGASGILGTTPIGMLLGRCTTQTTTTMGTTTRMTCSRLTARTTGMTTTHRRTRGTRQPLTMATYTATLPVARARATTVRPRTARRGSPKPPPAVRLQRISPRYD